MKPRHFKFVLLLLLAIAWKPSSSQTPRPPNLILIITDDMGWWDLGLHGHKELETPNLDRLAGEGIEFTHFYAAPVCTPTRAGILTGRYFQRTGAIDTYMGRDVLSADEITLPSLLQKAGYHTGLVGKWHLGRYAKYHPQSRGFDEFFGFWQYGFINRYFDSDELFRGLEPVTTAGYVTDVLADQAIDFVHRNREKPFFLDLAFNAPHSPYLAPDALVQRYLQKGLPLQEAQVAAMVHSIDQNVGRLLAALDKEGLRENTVVVFMSDNGGVSSHFKAGLRGQKATVYEGGIRVPFFARWPGHFVAGTKIVAMAHNLDIFPTFCELAGAKTPDDRKIDGKSLIPLLTGKTTESPHERLFQQWTRVKPDADQNWMARDRRWKLANGELFDLENDPGETKNLAGEHPDTAARLRGEFKQWIADVTAGKTYERVPIEVGQSGENPVEIDVMWAQLQGNLKPVGRNYIRDTIEGWSAQGDTASWKLDVIQPGRYQVMLHWGMEAGATPQKMSGTFYELPFPLVPRVLSAFSGSLPVARFEFFTRSTGGKQVYQSFDTGTVQLPRGLVTLHISPMQGSMPQGFALHKIWLKRIDP